MHATVAHIGWLTSCHFRRRVTALAQRGCADVVYTDAVPAGIDVTSLPFQVEVLPEDLLSAPEALLDWCNASLQAYSVDILHSHSTHFPACLGLFCSGVVRVNSLWDFVYTKDRHSPLFHQAILQGLQSGLLAEAMSFESPTVRQKWIAQGYVEKNALLHSWGVDANVFSPVSGDEVQVLRQELGILPEELVILSPRVASLPANIDILLQAVGRLRKYLPVRLVILGGMVTREARYLESLLAQPRIRESVVFAGAVDNDKKLCVYYAMSHVVASVHSNDHNPATVLEAFAMKRPVVACDLPTLQYWVHPQKNGMLVPHRDVPATERALAYILTVTKEEYARMGEHGADLVQRKACMDTALMAACDDYQKLASLSSAGAQTAYTRALWNDIRGQWAQSASGYHQAMAEGEEFPLLTVLLEEKNTIIGEHFPAEGDDFQQGNILEYFGTIRAHPAAVSLCAATEDEWPRLIQQLPAPYSLFRHDIIAALFSLLLDSPHAYLQLVCTIAERFSDSFSGWVAESIQWYGGCLGLWEQCAELMRHFSENGGTTLAVHALGCARMLGDSHPQYSSLLAQAENWSRESIACISPELDSCFRQEVHDEAVALLHGETACFVNWQKIYGTTDRPWRNLPQSVLRMGMH